jgi:5-hydroxyisourate hydrolase
MAHISTHVLDTARGVPAAGIHVELHFVDGDTRRAIASKTTNADGRTDEPLLAGEGIETGTYELTFHVAAYIAHTSVAVTKPPFLSDIVIRFGVADPDGRYHVPLLLSPYGYSTYRGS